jgi:Cu+-exporting ATPase
LSSTFTNGNILRIFGKNKFYLKNSDTIEKLKNIDTIVFDKTGTITQNNESLVQYEGKPLDAEYLKLVRSLVIQSTHPLSKSVLDYLPSTEVFVVANYKEYPGKGIEAEINGFILKLGSYSFVLGEEITNSIENISSCVYLKINNNYFGNFTVHNQYRKGLKTLVKSLESKFYLSILSGDNDAEEKTLKEIFNKNTSFYFKQSPSDKLNYIKALQLKNRKVAMIGDGLNDAGALKQSHIGISVSDNINNFSPACDAILDSSRFNDLKTFIEFAHTGQKVIIASFVISLLYNVIGLWYAVSGELSPVVAAILMPISSISIVLFTTITSSIIAKIKGL